MNGRAIAAISLALLGGGCSRQIVPAPLQAESARYIEGPLYAASELRARRILGVRLGMPLNDAKRELTTRGYVQRFNRYPDVVDTDGESAGWVDNFFTDRFGEVVSLTYARLSGGPALVSSIRYDRPLLEEEERQIEARRAEVLAEHGVPSNWFRWNNNGRVNDSMAYVTRASLRDGSLRQDVWSCHVNWRCHTGNGTNCRRILARAREPVLTVNFIYRGVSYELDDYAARYASLSRNRDFANPRYRPQRCWVAPAH